MIPLLLGGAALAVGVVALARGRFHLPLPKGSWYVSSPYGNRLHPITGLPSFHDGVDLSAPTDTEVYAVSGGTVESTTSASSGSKSGNSVSVRDSGGRLWSYLHLSAAEVTRSEVVSRGERLGWVGTTGSSTGPHLHLQVEDQDGYSMDPVSLIPALEVVS